MRKLFIILGIIILILGFFIGGPFYTFHRFKSGIDSYNADKVNSCIDFEKLRPNIKEQLEKTFSSGKDTNTSTNPMAVFFNKFISGFSDHLLRTYVTPEGIKTILEKKKELQTKSKELAAQSEYNKNSDSDKNIDMNKILENYSIKKLGINEFILTLNPLKPQRKIDVVMTRYKLFWKVTDIRFPEQFFEDFKK